MAKTKTKKHSLSDDLKVIILPFNLYSGFSAVVEELEENKFEYGGIHEHIVGTFLFKSKTRKEYITVSISDENLLIKQFSESQGEGKDALKILYVVKDSGRNFKIL